MKNKGLLILSLLLLLSSCSSSSSTISQYEGYQLIYNEEFDEEELDQSSWNYMLGDGSLYGLTNWGNDEAQYYKKENIEIKNGNLIIKAKKENYGGKSYTSGRISSKGKISTLYGKIEASIALPEVNGMWPAFWMLPENNIYGEWPYSGEIDIMEARGRTPSMTSSALHYGGPSDIYQSSSSIIREGTISDYHLYGVIWDEREISFYCDENIFLTISLDSKNAAKHWFCGSVEDNELAPFDQEFYLLINLAVGGNFDGGLLPDDDFEECEMKVDYVRIYQRI